MKTLREMIELVEMEGEYNHHGQNGDIPSSSELRKMKIANLKNKKKLETNPIWIKNKHRELK
jgi:hypothetical protein